MKKENEWMNEQDIRQNEREKQTVQSLYYLCANAAHVMEPLQ